MEGKLFTIGNSATCMYMYKLTRTPMLSHAHTHTHTHTHSLSLSLSLSLSRYLTESAEIRSVFLKITDLFDGKAQTIESALIQFCDSKEINLRNVMGFGSDGAAVMIGRETLSVVKARVTLF